MKKYFLYSISSLIILTLSSLYAQGSAQTTTTKPVNTGLSDADFFGAYDTEVKTTEAEKKVETPKEKENTEGLISFELYDTGFEYEETEEETEEKATEEETKAQATAKVEEKPKSVGLSDDDFFSAYDSDSTYVPSTDSSGESYYTDNSQTINSAKSSNDDLYANESAISEGKVGDGNIFSMGIDDLIKRADRGEIDAQKTIAEYYATGTMVDIDKEKAAFYYAKAGDMGDMDAAYNAGVLYQDCYNIEDNEDLAFKYFKMSANYNINAMFNLGACYVNGIGTRKDLIKAYYCFTKASMEIEQANEILKKITPVLGVVGLKKAEEFLLKTDSI